MESKKGVGMMVKVIIGLIITVIVFVGISFVFYNLLGTLQGAEQTVRGSAADISEAISKLDVIGPDCQSFELKVPKQYAIISDSESINVVRKSDGGSETVHKVEYVGPTRSICILPNATDVDVESSTCPDELNFNSDFKSEVFRDFCICREDSEYGDKLLFKVDLGNNC